MEDKIYQVMLDITYWLRDALIFSVLFFVPLMFQISSIYYFVIKTENRKESYCTNKDRLNLVKEIVKKRIGIIIYFYVWLYAGFMMFALMYNNIFAKVVVLLVFGSVAINMLLVSSDLEIDSRDVARRTLYLTIYKIHISILAIGCVILAIIVFERLNALLLYVVLPYLLVYFFQIFNLKNYEYIKLKCEENE